MKLARFVVTFALIVALGAAALAASVALFVPAAQTLASAVSPIASFQRRLTTPAQRSYVYDRNGKLMTTLFDVDRAPVKLGAVPKQLREAVIAIEDRKFYQHSGVDLAGMARAFTRDAGSGRLEQGASTITQQLVKNVWRQNEKRDFKEKMKEAWLAIQLESKLSKTEILEHYLNFVPFGNNAFGVEVAAERYFNKPVGELTLAESAMLAGIVQAPTALNPITYPADAARRRGQVLEAMRKTNKITRAEERASNRVPLPTQVFYPQASQRSYYIDALIGELTTPDPQDPANPANLLGKTKTAARNKLYRGGLRIYTNYDPVMQYTADLAIQGTIPQNQDQFTATLVSIDNSNGAIRAIAFGRGYGASQFNPAVDGLGRQAGSSFKAITLAAALSAGYSPDDRVDAWSLNWRLGPGSGEDSFYNLSGDCHGGSPTLTQAIAKSDNCAFVRTELSMGPGNYGSDGARRVETMAAQMGIDISGFGDPPVVSTTLGTNGVHGLEMAQAYSVIAADGVLHRAQYVSRMVGPLGKVLFTNNSPGKRILSPEVARTETQMLTGVLKSGTAAGLTIDRPAAGKTGTTDENVDAWFIGYTPQLTTAVWMGDPNGENSMSNVGGIEVFGATYPADIWKAFMETAHENLPVVEFIEPNEDLWPDPAHIDEDGRRESSYSRSYDDDDDDPTPTTAATVTPATVPPATPTTKVPPIVAPTTSPPPKVKPPATTPTPSTGP